MEIKTAGDDLKWSEMRHGQRKKRIKAGNNIFNILMIDLALMRKHKVGLLTVSLY